jgi:hypothetical protein
MAPDFVLGLFFWVPLGIASPESARKYGARKYSTRKY